MKGKVNSSIFKHTRNKENIFDLCILSLETFYNKTHQLNIFFILLLFSCSNRLSSRRFFRHGANRSGGGSRRPGGHCAHRLSHWTSPFSLQGLSKCLGQLSFFFSAIQSIRRHNSKKKWPDLLRWLTDYVNVIIFRTSISEKNLIKHIIDLYVN